MKIVVHKGVPSPERVLSGLEFGLRHIAFDDNRARIKSDALTIRIYSTGNENAKGESLFLGSRVYISVFAASHHTADDILVSIFHELWHLKQFLNQEPLPSIHASAVEAIEDEADRMSLIMLQEFLRTDNDPSNQYQPVPPA